MSGVASPIQIKVASSQTASNTNGNNSNSTSGGGTMFPPINASHQLPHSDSQESEPAQQLSQSRILVNAAVAASSENTAAVAAEPIISPRIMIKTRPSAATTPAPAVTPSIESVAQQPSPAPASSPTIRIRASSSAVPSSTTAAVAAELQAAAPAIAESSNGGDEVVGTLGGASRRDSMKSTVIPAAKRSSIENPLKTPTKPIPSGGADILVITKDESLAATPSSSSSSSMPAPDSVNRRSSTTQFFSAGNAALVLNGKSEEILCAICEAHIATIHCVECQLNLCTQEGGCNRTMHAPRKMRTHTRVPCVNGKPDFDHHKRENSSSRPTTALGVPTGNGSRPGTTQNGRSGTLETGSTSSAQTSPAPPRISRGGRGSMLGAFSPEVMAQMKTQPHGAAEVASAPPGGVAPGSARPAPNADNSSDSEDDTDAVAREKERFAASIQGPSCDQCHLAAAVVFCIDCQSSLCDDSESNPAGSTSCNKRIHKARQMAKHRQVRVEAREEVLKQLEDEEVAAAASAATASSAISPSSARNSNHTPTRASFIAPLSSRSSLTRQSPSPGIHSPPLSSHGRARTPSLLSPNSSQKFSNAPSFIPRPPSSSSSVNGRESVSPAFGANGATAAGGMTADDEFDSNFTQASGGGGGGGSRTSSRNENSSLHSPPSQRGGRAFMNQAAVMAAGASHRASIASTVGGSTPSSADGERERSSSACTPLPPAAAAAALIACGARECDNCDDHTAVSYCVECRMYLCMEGDCQQLIHRPTKMKSHQILMLATPNSSAAPASAEASKESNPEPAEATTTVVEHIIF